MVHTTVQDKDRIYPSVMISRLPKEVAIRELGYRKWLEVAKNIRSVGIIVLNIGGLAGI